MLRNSVLEEITRMVDENKSLRLHDPFALTGVTFPLSWEVVQMVNAEKAPPGYGNRQQITVYTKRRHERMERRPFIYADHHIVIFISIQLDTNESV